MSSSVQKPKHEKGTFHQQNVRKQTHPDEEFENEDEPSSKYLDKEGRKCYTVLLVNVLKSGLINGDHT